MSSGRIAQHRNYGDIMARHERDVKIKRITRIFIYFALIAILILVFFIFRRWERSQTVHPKPATAINASSDQHEPDLVKRVNDIPFKI